MKGDKRIALNIIATYGRSLYALVVGLFAARWVYLALGVEDYGLFGVVGVLAVFVAFFNELMAIAVGRFYAFAVGESQKEGFSEQGLENGRHWFNVALLVHSVLSAALILIGYPIGLWAVQHYLVIPPEKVQACIWVWRFSCLTCFVSMVSVPFTAMYSAKQEIAELTLYGFVTTTLNAVFFYYMASHPGAWLVRYAAWMCVMSVLPQMLMCVFAWKRYPECRFCLHYLWDVLRLKELVIYAGSRFVCSLSLAFSNQGMALAVNRLLGPVRNAALAIGNSVSGNTAALSNSCLHAFYPAITNAAGRGDLVQMRSLSYRMCKLSTLGMMVFAFPLIPEMETVMKVWLKTPPEGAAALCVIILIAAVFNHLTDGHWMAIFAVGKVTRFNLCESIGYFISFVLAVVLIAFGCGVISVGYGVLVGYLYAAVVKLSFGRRLCGLSVRYWCRRILLPCFLIGGAMLVAGFLPRLILKPSFARLLASGALSLAVGIVMIWAVALDNEEREYVRGKVKLAKKV